jgi:hypothetical protein
MWGKRHSRYTTPDGTPSIRTPSGVFSCYPLMTRSKARQDCCPYPSKLVEGVFCEVRMCGVPRTPYAGCWIAPVLCRKARECPDLRTQWGTPPEGPPFPSILVSKHISSAKKTPFAAYAKVDQSVTARYNFVVESGLPVSPLQGGPALLLPAPGPIPMREGFLCTM